MGPSFRLVLRLGLALAGGCASGADLVEPICVEGEDPPVYVRAPPEGPRGLFLEAAELERELADVPAGDEEAPAARAPHLAWDGRSWHLAWGTHHAVLDETGALRGEIETRGEGGDATGLEPSGCRSAVVAASDRAGRSVLAWLDPDGVVQGASELAGTAADVSRHGARWWVVSDVSPPSGDGTLAVFDVAPEHGGAALRAQITDAPHASPRIVATAAGAVVAWADRAGIVQRAIGDDGEERTQRVMTANVWSRGAMESVLLRGEGGADRIAIAATDGAMVHVAMTDVGARAVIAGPLAVSRTTVRGVAPGLAAIPERGVVALCHPAGPGPWGGDDVIDRVELSLIGSDASPTARAVEVGRGGEVRSAACGWNGREILVAWRRTLEGREQIAVRRIRVREDRPPVLAAHARPL